MKLSELTEGIDKQITNEEKDLELPVVTAQLSVTLKRGQEIVLHNWEYTSNKL